MPPEPLAFMYRTSSIQKPQNIGLMQYSQNMLTNMSHQQNSSLKKEKYMK